MIKFKKLIVDAQQKIGHSHRIRMCPTRFYRYAVIKNGQH